ncbi:uncharacterized protein LOC114886187 [Monodon monoceros]|uniref:uncharacterized protein LOC114886187 n=1 Tax=Monodon monoceros TaxID=40151 RepID=UPI0010F82117|nr:uncharacterized protein LOC114886187 [Monodon monoceros]
MARRRRLGEVKSCGVRREVPPSPVPGALGGDSRPDPALRRTPRKPLTFTICRGGRGGRQPARGRRNAPANFSRIRAVHGAPSCQEPRRDAPTSVFRQASPAGGSQDSERQAEVRLHLEDEVATEPRGSASTSRGSLLTLHCEEAAAPAAEEEAAPGRPPPRARQPPSGRPRPRRTRLLSSAEPHTGRAALSTGSSAGLTPPSAKAAAGGVQPPPGAPQPDPLGAGPAAPGERTAEHEGATRSFGQGRRLHRVARKIAGGGKGR